jgi:hypothetical protein
LRTFSRPLADTVLTGAAAGAYYSERAPVGALYVVDMFWILVAGAPNHRNLLHEVLSLFAKNTVQPFDAAT